MRELDHHPEQESRYNCDLCSDIGIHNETRLYCDCPLGLQRCNTDKVAEMLRGAPFTDAMWTMQQATAKAERAIAAADKVLLIDRTQRAEAAKLNAEGRAFEMAQKLEQVERELAKARNAGWQPIETAPKDGSVVLLSSESAGGAWCGMYMEKFMSGFRPSNPWRTMMLNMHHLPNAKNWIPTHWMPLPAPPAASVAQAKKEQSDGDE